MNTDESFFQSMKHDERRVKAFGNVMSYMQTRPGFGSTSKQLLSAFDWNSIKKVVDVGGGIGTTAAEIVRNTSQTTCIVQDLPEVIAEAKGNLNSTVSERVTFIEHDFFTEQPIKDADVYFLRWILHDWSDKKAVQILRSLTKAMRPGAYVIIQEFIVPPSGTIPFYYEKAIRCMDFAMTSSHNSRERSIGDWIELFGKADARFKLSNTSMGGAQGLGVLQFSWE